MVASRSTGPGVRESLESSRSGQPFAENALTGAVTGTVERSGAQRRGGCAALRETPDPAQYGHSLAAPASAAFPPPNCDNSARLVVSVCLWSARNKPPGGAARAARPPSPRRSATSGSARRASDGGRHRSSAPGAAGRRRWGVAAPCPGSARCAAVTRPASAPGACRASAAAARCRRGVADPCPGSAPAASASGRSTATARSGGGCRTGDSMADLLRRVACPALCRGRSRHSWDRVDSPIHVSTRLVRRTPPRAKTSTAIRVFCETAARPETSIAIWVMGIRPQSAGRGARTAASGSQRGAGGRSPSAAGSAGRAATTGGLRASGGTARTACAPTCARSTSR